jgi:tetraacyldisaccharide 4'-kinase
MSAGGIAQAVETAWTGTSAGDRLLVGLLAPLAAGYGAGVAVRNALYDRGWLRSERVPATVVSVGNLTVGGSGKTPTALWLATALERRGRRPALVARGYGKRRPGVVIVGDGRPLVDPADGGDEAVLLAMRSGLPVVTGERRADAARAACERFGADTIVLDDGFQHRALARDADLVLLPPDGLPSRLLPAGPLREPAGAVARARAVLALGDETRLPPRPAVASATPAFAGRLVPTGVVTMQDAAAPVVRELASLPRDDVVAVAGVARPERFFALLERLGCRVVERVSFPDHYAYVPADLARVGRHRPVLTTEKDLVKLARLPGADAVPLAAVRIDVDVEDGERLVDVLLAPAEVALRRD